MASLVKYSYSSMKWTDSAAWTLGVACQLRYHIRQHSNWTMTVYHRICLISLFITAGAYAKITNATIGCIKNWSQTSSYQSRSIHRCPFACLATTAAVAAASFMPRRYLVLHCCPGGDARRRSGPTWRQLAAGTSSAAARNVFSADTWPVHQPAPL